VHIHTCAACASPKHLRQPHLSQSPLHAAGGEHHFYYAWHGRPEKPVCSVRWDNRRGGLTLNGTAYGARRVGDAGGRRRCLLRTGDVAVSDVTFSVLSRAAQATRRKGDARETWQKGARSISSCRSLPACIMVFLSFFWLSAPVVYRTGHARHGYTVPSCTFQCADIAADLAAISVRVRGERKAACASKQVLSRMKAVLCWRRRRQKKIGTEERAAGCGAGRELSLPISVNGAGVGVGVSDGRRWRRGTASFRCCLAGDVCWLHFASLLSLLESGAWCLFLYSNL